MGLHAEYLNPVTSVPSVRERLFLAHCLPEHVTVGVFPSRISRLYVGIFKENHFCYMYFLKGTSEINKQTSRHKETVLDEDSGGLPVTNVVKQKVSSAPNLNRPQIWRQPKNLKAKKKKKKGRMKWLNEKQSAKTKWRQTNVSV